MTEFEYAQALLDEQGNIVHVAKTVGNDAERVKDEGYVLVRRPSGRWCVVGSEADDQQIEAHDQLVSKLTIAMRDLRDAKQELERVMNRMPTGSEVGASLGVMKPTTEQLIARVREAQEAGRTVRLVFDEAGVSHIHEEGNCVKRVRDAEDPQDA